MALQSMASAHVYAAAINARPDMALEILDRWDKLAFIQVSSRPMVPEPLSPRQRGRGRGFSSDKAPEFARPYTASPLVLSPKKDTADLMGTVRAPEERVLKISSQFDTLY